MLDVVMNFDRSHLKVIPLSLMMVTVMPMLLAFVSKRELTWQPARWLLVAILAGCLVHLFLPGYTAQRPRDMTMIYQEVGDEPRGFIALESVVGQPDVAYAESHDFLPTQLNNGRLGKVERPAREVPALGLPGLSLNPVSAERERGGWRRTLQLESEVEQRFIQISVPLDAGLEKAWINGELALDTTLQTKHKRKVNSIRLVNVGAGPVSLELLTSTSDPFEVAVVTWHDLPGLLTAPFLGNWPDNARAAYYGPRAEKVQEIRVAGVD